MSRNNPSSAMSFVVIFSLLDRKTREFGQLLLARNEETMERLVIDTITGSGSMIEKYPEDFDLFRVGEFDLETGNVLSESPVLVRNVALILDAVRRPEPVAPVGVPST